MKKKVINSCLAVLLCSMLFPMSASAETVYDVPTNSSFKSFMSYKTITSKTSAQYKLQQECVTDDNGLRLYNGRYTIAIGTAFNASVGDYVDVELSTGVVLNCIVGDIKKNIHTDSTNMQVAHNGNVVEFIVGNGLSSAVRSAGNISKIPGFEGYIESITVYSDSDTNSMDFERVLNYEDKVVDKYDVCLPSGDSLHTVVTPINNVVVDDVTYEEVTVGDDM